ncbi:MAG: lysophospholipase [Parasporobacterium sp.]|nr:lysophospholipase [Parasporobacterium sp.]
MQSLSEHAIIYEPQGPKTIVGVVQIIHGMSEHQLRYAPLARYLSANGYVVITSDLRGHGDNVRSDNELGFFGDNAIAHLVGDIHEITLYIRDHYTGLPYILLGHSMGTLIASTYFKKYDNFVDGLFLSGMPSDNPARGIGKGIIALIQSLKGQYHRSKLINNMCNGAFVKAFRSEGSDFAWLATDPEVYRKYEQDPKCGYIFTLNGFSTLLDLLGTTYSQGSWIKKNLTVPIRLIAGSDDPVIGGKAGFQKAEELFRKQGYTNVEAKLYPGQRHEIFNDTMHETVWAELLYEFNEIAVKD